MAGLTKGDYSRILHNHRCKLKKDIQCCLQELDLNIDLTPLLDAIANLTLEIENNVSCSMAKACDADCNVVMCYTCFDVEGTPVSTSHLNPDGSPYAGDLSTLDIGCVACSDPIPSYEVINCKVCFEDCSEGFNLIKVNTSDDTVTFLGSFNLDGTPATLAVAPCPEIKVVSTEQCLIGEPGPCDGVVCPPGEICEEGVCVPNLDCSNFDTSYATLNNTTDNEFSTNATQMKWNHSGGGNNTDGAQAFTQAMMDCIDAGGSATVNFTDQDDAAYEFIATSYTGTPQADALFTGTNNSASIAGKLKTATLSCQC